MAYKYTVLRLRRLKRCFDSVKSAKAPLLLKNNFPQQSVTSLGSLGLGNQCRHLSVLSCMLSLQPVSQSIELSQAHSLNRFSTSSTVYSSDDSKNSTEKKPNKRTEVTYEELVDLINEGDITLIDVRDPKEIEETGMMTGAINIPMHQLVPALRMPDEAFSSFFHVEKPGLGEDAGNVIFSCLLGKRSAAALQIAHKLGFERARHYPGGWKEWSEKQS